MQCRNTSQKRGDQPNLARSSTAAFLSVFLVASFVSEDRELTRSDLCQISEGTGCEVHDNEFCVLEDELDSGASPPTPLRSLPPLTYDPAPPDGLFVDLTANPERFTGYAGDSSARVWKAIYEENCFTPVPFVDATRATSEGGSGFASLGGLHSGAWGESEKKLFGSLAGPRDAGDEVCLEKRVFYRVLSGESLSRVLGDGRRLIGSATCRPSRLHLDPHLRRLPGPNHWEMGQSLSLLPSSPPS